MATCGNGTAGAFAPRLLGAPGIEVVLLDVDPDGSFPRYNRNSDGMVMLHAIAHAVTGARRRYRPRLRRRPLRGRG